MKSLSAERALAVRLCVEAGDVALRYRASQALGAYDKPDDMGPVTDADREADALIAQAISAAFPEDGLLTEEGSLRREGRSGRLWLVDPIDGTREFIAGRDDFSVMIGLCINGEPALGVVYRPVTDALAWGEVGVGAFLERGRGGEALTRLKVSACGQLEGAHLMRSRSHPSAAVNALCERVGIQDVTAMGSFGLKCVEVARGAADLYVNLSSKTSLWDSAGPAAIVLAAGGQVTDPDGAAIDYRQPGPQHPRGVLVTNGPLHAQALRAIRPLLTGP